MRSLIIMAALIAAPALAQETVRIPDGSYVVRSSWDALKTPAGRAAFRQTLQETAEKACANVRPLRDQHACEARIVADAEARAIPPVAGKLRLARQEATDTALAAR